MNFFLSDELQQQLDALNPTQAAFVAGYLWKKSQDDKPINDLVTMANTATTPAQKNRKITILSASQTGNAHRISKQLFKQLEAENLEVTLVLTGDYKVRQLAKEDIVLLIISTQGEGEPPEEAIPLHHFLFGRKKVDLSQLSFAVFGLGDSSYPDFCQAGKDFDEKLEELGGTRLIDRLDADLDFQSTADNWVSSITKKLANITTISSSNKINNGITEQSLYHKTHPYDAELLEYQPIVDIHSEKQTTHIEIDLGESGLIYQAGDALGIITKNKAETITEILTLSGLSANEAVKRHHEETTLINVLENKVDLNQLTPNFLSTYGELRGEAVKTNINTLNLAILLHDFPPKGLTAQILCDGLKPLTPRLYSIASSQDEVSEEVHLCVAEVSFSHHGQNYQGSV
ncbi:MAG: flavodoxin domain-containing protein, partial [Ostreibacterium sp.]